MMKFSIVFTILAAAIFPVHSFAQATNSSQSRSSGTDATNISPTSSSDLQQNTVDVPSRPSATPSVDQSKYIIGAGDVLEVAVYGAADLSQRPTVNSEGNIYMPLVGYVHIGGMHVEDAQAAVEQAYLKKDVLKSPHVSIVVTSYSGGVVLMGEVGRTGIYPIVGAGKLFDIFAEAGGTTSNAGQIVTITSKDGSEPQTVFLASDPEKSMSSNVPVHQGDTIIVSKAGAIYVVGEVLAPSGFLMNEQAPYTVMKAVAMAHGVTKFAKTNKARIVRRTPAGEQEIPVPLDKILYSKSPDVRMQANDILFIPSSKGKIAASRSIDVAISLASGVAFYGLYH